MDTPWWSNLIAVVVTAVVSVVGTLYALRGPKSGEPVSAASTVGSFFKDTITYIPHILLLYGVLADMFTYQGVFSIPSLIGLLSIIVNKFFAYVWKGLYTLGDSISEVFKSTETGQQTGGDGGLAAAPTTASQRFFKDYDGCTVQGFSWAESPYAPQTLVVTATVFLYYIFDIVNNRGWGQAAVSIAMFILLFLGQVFIIGDCPPQGEGMPGKWTRALFALTEGFVFGGIGFSVVQSVAPERMPTKAYSVFPKVNRKDLKEGPDGTLVDDKGIPYKILPDGSAIPDMCSEEGAQKFAGFLGTTMGTGTSAVPDSCRS
jgi:hypothetical protein